MPTKVQRIVKTLIHQWTSGILRQHYDLLKKYDDRYTGISMLIDIERAFFAICKEYELFVGHPHPCSMVHPAAGPKLDWLAWHALVMQRCALMQDVVLDLDREVQLCLTILRARISDASTIVLEFIFPLANEYYCEYTPNVFWP